MLGLPYLNRGNSGQTWAAQIKNFLMGRTKCNFLRFSNFLIFVPKSWCSLKKKGLHLESKSRKFQCFLKIPSGHKIEYELPDRMATLAYAEAIT